MRLISVLTFTLSSLISAFSQVSQINIDNTDNPNEPSICFSRNGDSLLYAAANITNFYTINTSKRTIHKQKASSPLGVYGDPVLHWAKSSLYYTHLSKTPKKEYGDWFDRIVVQRIDSLRPWKEKSYGVGYNMGKMQDKPWLSSDNWSLKYKDNIYVTWTEFDTYGSSDPYDYSRIRFAALDSGNDSFNPAITISDTVGNCEDGDNTLEGATTAVDASGNLYASWAGHGKIYFDQSSDGGKTWGTDRIVATQVKGWDMDMPNIMRANGMPFLVADKERNALYICWADERNGQADIWLLVSKNLGKTWSDPILLNLDKTNTHQYFPNIAIDENTGDVHVAYYDFKTSPTNTFYTITLATYTTDGKVNNEQLTPFVTALPGKQVFYGDYLDIDVYNNQLAVAYTAYDLSQKSEINLVTEATISNGVFSKIAINNTLAIVRNNDTAQVILNVEHPHKTKITIHLEKNGKKSRYVYKAIYRGSNTSWDHILGAVYIEPEAHISRIKYRIRDLAIRNVYKRKIKLD
ncbi:glycoside hydrolase [Bacteroidia bacterium]|jgi:hypothetical protein|nr:glycoside hydrolase [Bacteroidia bacterium]